MRGDSPESDSTVLYGPNIHVFEDAEPLSSSKLEAPGASHSDSHSGTSPSRPGPSSRSDSPQPGPSSRPDEPGPSSRSYSPKPGPSSRPDEPSRSYSPQPGPSSRPDKLGPRICKLSSLSPHKLRGKISPVPKRCLN